MNLLEIRQKVIELSGRADLATTNIDTNDTDAGIDFYIQSGSRALDLELENRISFSWYQVTLAANASIIPMRHCRYVESVLTVDDEDSEVALTKFGLGDLTVKYPKLGATTVGTPIDYATFPIVRPPDQYAYGMPVNYTGVIVMPPTEEAQVIKVYGKFHSLELVNNSDENYWSNQYPELLIASSLKELERFYRNREGVADYNEIVQDKVRKIDQDSAAQDAAGNLVMEG